MKSGVLLYGFALDAEQRHNIERFQSWQAAAVSLAPESLTASQ